MGCIQSYFKRAHTAGLSPSSTQDSNSKTGGDDAGSCAQAANSTGTVEKDKLSADFTSTGDRAPEEPESNDTSYGVEATAVRTLAASTGTVAILGTTAKTPQSRRESRVSNLDIDEPVDKKEAVQTDSINVEIKDEHKNGGTNLVKKLDEVANTVEKIETVVNSSSVTTTVDKIESVINSSTKTESKVETKEEVVVVDVEKTSTENVSTNEKAVEKPTIQTTTALVEDVKVDDDVAASPLEDGGFSENNFAEDEDDRPTTVLEIEKAQSSAEMRTSVSEASENEDTKGMDDEISSEQLKTNSLSDTTLSESYNVGLDSFKQPEDESATPVVENIGENEVSGGVVVVESQKSPDQNGVLDNDLQKEPELKKKEDVVKEVDILKKEISQIESKNLEADSKKEVDEEPIVKTVATKVESVPSSRNSGVDQALGNDLEGKVDLKVVENKVENGLSSVVVNGVPEVVDEISDDKMSAAATTIQATFRGYQTRQQNAAKSNETAETNGTNSNDKLVDEPVQPSILPNVEVVKVMQLTEIVDEGVEKKLESIIASKEGLIEKVDDKLDAAATAIQASFRGYQTRQNIKKDDNDNKTGKSGEKDGESVGKAVKGDEVGQKEKEIVIKSVDVVEASSKVGDSVEKTTSDGTNHKDSDEKSKSDEIDHKAEGKSVVKTTSVEASQKEKETEPDVHSKKVEELVEKSSSDVAATTIQANFRGYQARQNLQKKEEESEKKEVESKKEIVDNKVKESFDKTNSVEVSKIGETIVDNKEKESLDKTVAQNSKSIDAQVEKVPRSLEQTESVSPKNTQLDTVKKSQESSEGSSFDSVQNVSLDPVTCVSIKDKSKVDKKDSTEVGGNSEELKENDNISLEETKEKLKDEEKESSAATTIQANFRGYQARQNLQKKEEESGKKDEEGVSGGEGGEEGEEEDVKVSTAATKIQAGFRGYQTRKKLKEDEDDTVVIEALTSRTPELEESVREEVDEICKRAVETTENLISQGLHKFHKSGSVEETEEKRVEGRENEGIVDESEVVDVAKQTIEAVVEKAEKIADEKLNSAATTIQASFRGFQARQNLEKTTDIDGLPDFPPSTEDEDYTPVPDDDDLPLPDLEALESSYSEEVATEPLLPPPPATASGLPPSTTNLHNLVIPETEEVSEASTEVGTIEEDLKSLQRPQECDELDRLERDSSDGESSLSSAATKIQAGVRGYLTRKHINHGQTGTTSTSGPSLLSSDRSLGDFSSSREEDGPVRSMISTEEETEVGRHSGSSPPQVKRTGAAMKKRMSLDSRMAAGSSPAFSRTSRAMSVSAVREGAGNEEVWEMLQSELSCAATKIQSNFRGYQARKQLRRGDAVQMPTTSSSTTPGSNSLDGSVSRMGHVTEHTRSSGEYHDMIALTPPNIPNIGEEEEEEVEEEEKGKRKKTSQQQSDGSSSRDEDAMVKRRQGDESRPQKGEEGEEAAAARIQAGFRGYKVRRNMNAQDVAAATSDGHKSPQQSTTTTTTTTTTGSNNNHSSAEIEAATKIQAGFRGFKTRQELKSSKSGSAEISK